MNSAVKPTTTDSTTGTTGTSGSGNWNNSNSTNNGTTGTTGTSGSASTDASGNMNGNMNGNSNASGSMNGTTGMNSANWNNTNNANSTTSGNMDGSMSANANMNAGMNDSMSSNSGMQQAQLVLNTNTPIQPYIHLYGSNGSFVGFTGCNRISGNISGTGGNVIHFDNTSPSTAIPCVGGNDEQAFLSALQRVNAYSISNGQLQLMDGNNVVMTFSKNGGGYTQGQ